MLEWILQPLISLFHLSVIPVRQGTVGFLGRVGKVLLNSSKERVEHGHLEAGTTLLKQVKKVLGKHVGCFRLQPRDRVGRMSC